MKQAGENLRTEIVVNPQVQSLVSRIKQFVLSGAAHYHLVYAGHAFQVTTVQAYALPLSKMEHSRR